MLLIDLGIPGDIAPEIGDLEDAFVYALEDLERIAEGGRARRDRAIAAASAILEEELDRWGRERASRAAVPALVALRRHFERARAQVLAHGSGMNAEAATRLLINRLLHEPTTALKALTSEPAHTAEERRRIERTLLKLFGVEKRYGTPGGDDGTDAQS
jgi:glutamyl-tRNA reductase